MYLGDRPDITPNHTRAIKGLVRAYDQFYDVMQTLDHEVLRTSSDGLDRAFADTMYDRARALQTECTMALHARGYEWSDEHDADSAPLDRVRRRKTDG